MTSVPSLPTSPWGDDDPKIRLYAELHKFNKRISQNRYSVEKLNKRIEKVVALAKQMDEESSLQLDKIRFWHIPITWWNWIDRSTLISAFLNTLISGTAGVLSVVNYQNAEDDDEIPEALLYVTGASAVFNVFQIVHEGSLAWIKSNRDSKVERIKNDLDQNTKIRLLFSTLNEFFDSRTEDRLLKCGEILKDIDPKYIPEQVRKPLIAVLLQNLPDDHEWKKATYRLSLLAQGQVVKVDEGGTSVAPSPKRTKNNTTRTSDREGKALQIMSADSVRNITNSNASVTPESEEIEEEMNKSQLKGKEKEPTEADLPQTPRSEGEEKKDKLAEEGSSTAKPAQETSSSSIETESKILEEGDKADAGPLRFDSDQYSIEFERLRKAVKENLYVDLDEFVFGKNWLDEEGAIHKESKICRELKRLKAS